MSNLFQYYQLKGEDAWIPVKAGTDLSHIKPTFETVLALDTLLESDPDLETRDKIKYLGPLYFDIDSTELEDSIESAKGLLSKLLAAGLSDHDIEIYASGKKGFHLLVPTVCFMEKPDEPVTKLPAIYKEMAFKLVVPFLDFRVYTARRGRMLRTVYNQRENGLYKVALTADRLRTMTAEDYPVLASQPTGKAVTRPCFNARFSMLFVAAQQRVAATKPKRSKPPTPDVFKRDLSVVNQLLRGDCQQGFNKIALQLAIYSREVGWAEDDLVQAARVLLEEHQSDGYRYNTRAKREAELRRMVHYVDDNSGYSYSSTVLRNMVAVSPPIAAPGAAPAPVAASSEDAEQADEGAEPAEVPEPPPAPENVTTSEFMAIRVSLEGIYSEDGEKCCELSNASIGNLSIAHVVNGNIASMQADIYVGGQLRQRGVMLPTDAFTSSAGLHRELIRFGSGFYGSDMQARAVLGALHVAGAPSVVALNHAGLDLVKLPNSQHKALRDGVLVWTGEGGAKTQAWAKDLANFSFSEEECHQGVSDLMNAPHPAEYFTTEAAREELRMVWKALWASNNETTLGLIYGWMTACFYRPLIHAATNQFPLLHVAGAAGSGKTQNVRLATRLHSFRNELPETTPNSTPFALGQLISGYAGTPILLDEYKAHKMSDQKLEGFRALFRDLYNGKASLRGGGGGRPGGGTVAGSWKTMSVTQMRAPLIFVAEALETESAIAERIVPVTATKRRSPRSYEAFSYVTENRWMLSILGRGIVETVLMTETVDSVGKALTAKAKALGVELRTPQVGDTIDLSRARRNINERPLHNTAVVLFGLERLWEAVHSILGDEAMVEFEDTRKAAVAGVKESLLDASCIAMPELIKWVIDLGDMMRTNSNMGRQDTIPAARLVEMVEEDRVYLVLNVRSAYSDYRAYCRGRGLPLYYANAESAIHALRNAEGYSRQKSTTDTVYLDWDSLVEAGATQWYTKAVKVR